MSESPRDAPEPEKPRRKFLFKPREFVVENPPASTPSSHGPTDVREHFAIASGVKPASTPSATPRENEVHQILRDNVAHAQTAGLNDVKPAAPRRSRRLLDYVIVTVAVNLVIGGLALKFRDAPIFLVFALAAFVLFNLQFSWKMWAIMDDY